MKKVNPMLHTLKPIAIWIFLISALIFAVMRPQPIEQSLFDFQGERYFLVDLLSEHKYLDEMIQQHYA
jgi:hypothetical protein